MRNIFDQYNGPENRLSHALACCLDRDSKLLRQFVVWTTSRRRLSWKKLKVLEQHVPGQPIEISESDDEKIIEQIGLPDLWIHAENGWSLLIENKVKSTILTSQLERHRRTAEKNGFVDIDLLVLAPTLPTRQLSGIRLKSWSEVYCWMRRQAAQRDSRWAACFADYLEVAEARMIAQGYLTEGTLTEFDGIPFGVDRPYNYLEAKRVLRLAVDELRKRADLKKMGMDEKGKGRPAITGRRGASVWDFIPLKAARGKNFTQFPHLTLSIQTDRFLVVVSLPNGVPGRMRQNLTAAGSGEFIKLVRQVATGVTQAIRKVKGAFPFVEVVQRRYPFQNSAPIYDARIEFNLRTAIPDNQSRVKSQPQWLEAGFEALKKKRSNLQFAIGAVLPYGPQELRNRSVLDIVAGVWLGCRPWIDRILKQSSIDR